MLLLRRSMRLWQAASRDEAGINYTRFLKMRFLGEYAMILILRGFEADCATGLCQLIHEVGQGRS